MKRLNPLGEFLLVFVVCTLGLPVALYGLWWLTILMAK